MSICEFDWISASGEGVIDEGDDFLALVLCIKDLIFIRNSEVSTCVLTVDSGCETVKRNVEIADDIKKSKVKQVY